MWEITVIKVGVGSIGFYAFRNRAEAVAKRDELKAQNPELSYMLAWSN